MTTITASDIQLDRQGYVAILTLCRPPHNFLAPDLLARIAQVLETLDQDNSCRAVVLASGVKSFCAGADFASRAPGEKPDPRSEEHTSELQSLMRNSYAVF